MTDYAPLKNTDLTPDDLELLEEILNDYLEGFDAEDELFNGVSNPDLKHTKAENLYGRFLGVDLSGSEPVQHHPDCTCDWCELMRDE
jgi:hypothetical protein